MLDLLDTTFTTSPCEAVCKGFCVVLDGAHQDGSDRNIGAIYYAGPIGGLRNVSGKQVLLHPEDFAFLEQFLKQQNKRRKRMN